MDGAAPPARHTDGCRHLTKLGHVPALDGLRGVAVAAVLVFHGGVSWAPGGFLGVDVFFVLSGFLITTLLLEEAASSGGRISLGAFWARRVRRLVPALAVVCIAVVVAAPWIAEAHSASSIRLDAAAALSYVANWRFILTDAAYFDRTAGPSPLEHTWSLGVEEQFYVVWPLLAVALRGAPWRLAAVALTGAV
ncbi:MAG TPA: acyltransferase, partial [Acidimicrobiales bacterium]|nr:acyltransferase [Acidimicrobiales bacterium]